MKKIRISKIQNRMNVLLKAFLVSMVSISVAFGQTMSNYLAIALNEPPKAELSTVYVDAGSGSAKSYADDLAARMAQRLSEQGLTGRVTVQSGYGCDASFCLKVAYTVDGYTFGQEIKISDSLTAGNGPAPNLKNPSKPKDPTGSDPSSDAARALRDAQRNYDQAVNDVRNAANKYDNSKRNLDQANRDLAGVSNDARSAENRLNSAINGANSAKDEALRAGQKAAEAAQKASDRKTERDRLADFKPKLEAERGQLENDLKKLEGEVNQAAANTNSAAEGAVTTQNGKAQGIASSTRERQKSAVSSHNTASKSLSNSIALDKEIGDIKPDAPISEGSKFRTPENSIGGEKLKQAAFALDTAKQTLGTLSARQREPGGRILPVAQSTLYMADNAYARGDIDQGDFAIRATSALMEMAIGIAPLAVLLLAPEALVLMTATVAGALALDLYHSYTGQHILTGEPLNGLDRSLSIIGVAVSIIPIGSAVKAGTQALGKALQLGDEVLLATMTAAESADFLTASKGAETIVESAGEVGEALFRSNQQINWNVADRVVDQLKDPRMGSLAGKISPNQLVDYANSANAKRFIDTRPDPNLGLPKNNINILQEIDGKLIRITTPNNEFKIISVGPIQMRNIRSSIERGDFIPMTKFDVWE